MSVNGCVTRSVLDTALYLDVVTAGGGDPGGPPPPDRPFVEAARTAPGALRIAVSHKPARAAAPPIVTDEVKRALAETEELLRSLGHDVQRHDPRYGTSGNHLVARYLRGIADDVRATPRPDLLEERSRGLAKLGDLFPERVVRGAVAAADSDREKLFSSLNDCDVLMTPTVGEPPVEVRRWEGKSALKTVITMARTYCFTPVWNHTGQPAAAVPAGFTEDGLPLSVTLVGKPNDEATLLSLAAQIEAERPWADRRPALS
jgi:amidase